VDLGFFGGSAVVERDGRDYLQVWCWWQVDLSKCCFIACNIFGEGSHNNFALSGVITHARYFAFGSRAGVGKMITISAGSGQCVQGSHIRSQDRGKLKNGPAGLGGVEELSWEDPDYTNRSNKSNEFGNLP